MGLLSPGIGRHPSPSHGGPQLGFIGWLVPYRVSVQPTHPSCKRQTWPWCSALRGPPVTGFQPPWATEGPQQDSGAGGRSQGTLSSLPAPVSGSAAAPSCAPRWHVWCRALELPLPGGLDLLDRGTHLLHGPVGPRGGVPSPILSAGLPHCP